MKSEKDIKECRDHALKEADTTVFELIDARLRHYVEILNWVLAD